MSRPATRIHDLAKETGALLNRETLSRSDKQKVRSNVAEIQILALDIDARTGTNDPSLKGRLKGAIAALLGR